MKRVLSITLGLMVVGQSAVFAAAPAPATAVATSEVTAPAVAKKGWVETLTFGRYGKSVAAPAAAAQAPEAAASDATGAASSAATVVAVAPAGFNDLTSHCQKLAKSLETSDLDKARTELKYVQAILGSEDNVVVVPAKAAGYVTKAVNAIVVTGRKSLVNRNAADIEAALTELGFVEYGINSHSTVTVKAAFLKAVLDNLQSLLGDVTAQPAQVEELYQVLTVSALTLQTMPDAVVEGWLKVLSDERLAKIVKVTPAGSSWARYVSGGAVLTAAAVALMTKKK